RHPRVNLPVANLERHANQVLAERRTADALARIRLEQRAVSRAEDVAAILIEKAVLDPVEAERDVAASVDERVMLAAPVDDEAFDVLAAHGQGELLRFSRRDFAHAGDVQRGHHASVPKNACPRSRYLTQRIAQDASADSARFHYDQCLFVRSERSRLVIS